MWYYAIDPMIFNPVLNENQILHNKKNISFKMHSCQMLLNIHIKNINMN